MSRLVRRNSFLTSAAVLSLLGASLAITPAYADEAPPPKGWIENAEEKALRDPSGSPAKLEGFRAWIGAQPGLDKSGFIESVLQYETGTMTLLWKGGGNTLQQQIIAEGQRRGVTVLVEKRKYDAQQVKRAAEILLASSGKDEFKNFKINAAGGIAAGFDGIYVAGTPVNATMNTTVAAATVQQAKAMKTSAAAVTAKAGVMNMDALARAAAVKTGLDAQIQLREPVVAHAATRSKDLPAFNAGGFITTASTRICSTAFGVRINGATYTTTARHCTKPEGSAPWRARDSSTSYGTPAAYSSDAAAVRMSTGGTNWMFDGAWNNAEGYKKTVKGFHSVSIGSIVFTSGGNSGVHGNIRVNRMGLLTDDKYGLVSMIEAIQQNGTIASAAGDSGGPVFSISGYASGYVGAVGMIQLGGTALTNCGSMHDPGNRCSALLMFTSMEQIVRSFPGATLVTG